MKYSFYCWKHPHWHFLLMHNHYQYTENIYLRILNKCIFSVKWYMLQVEIFNYTTSSPVSKDMWQLFSAHNPWHYFSISFALEGSLIILLHGRYVLKYSSHQIILFILSFTITTNKCANKIIYFDNIGKCVIKHLFIHTKDQSYIYLEARWGCRHSWLSYFRESQHNVYNIFTMKYLWK